MLKQFQLDELDMLKEIAKRLEKAEIPFYLTGGSCIGALRHKGFIPWDDDVDIAIMRRDFDKAEKVLASLGGTMIYDAVENHRIADAPLGHVYKLSSLPLEKSPRIDVFAIDTVPNSKILKKYQKFCALVYHVCVLRRPSKNRGKINRAITWFICKCFPKFLLDWLQRLSYKGLTKWKNSNQKYVINMYGVRGEKEIVPHEFFGQPRYVPFEHTLMPIPQKAEEYMTQVYGDYMEYPPEKERAPMHFSDITVQ